MSGYTPTTEEIIEEWTDGSVDVPESRKQFFRWLAAHDAEVLHRAALFLRGSENPRQADNTLQSVRHSMDDAGYELLQLANRGAVAAGVVAEEPEARSLTPEEVDALPIGAVVMTETNVERFGAYEQRVWQRFGGQPDWQFGVPRHEWQSTDGGFERVDELDRLRGRFGFNRRVTLLWVPVKQEGAE